MCACKDPSSWQHACFQQYVIFFVCLLPGRFPLSKWALELNELTPELRAKLPPTDDRLRPDMRLFEHGYFLEVSARTSFS